MIQPFKQSLEKSESKQLLSWHPNFSNPARLPDIKVVRTTFFFNGASVAILSAFLLYFGDKEYNLYQINSDIAINESLINIDKTESAKAVIEYGKYIAEEKKLVEVLNLTKDPFIFSDFIIHIGNTVPKRVTLQRIVYRGAGQLLLMTATVQGLDDTTGDVASEYVKQLQSDKSIKDFFDDVTLTGTVRNTDRSTLSLEISMLSKPVKK
jgi:hypothetical protein